MSKIMKFENTPIDVQIINGVPMFELYSVGMALGYARNNGKSGSEHGVHPENKKLFPYKSRIDKVVKNAEIQLVLRNGKPYITESQLYDFMLEARTDKCRAFRKWLTNEVLPELNHTGTYTMAKQDKQLELYDYFDKTYNDESVLSSMDVSYLTNINYSVVDWYARTYLIKGTDYYCLKGDELQRYKQENLKVSRLSSAVIVFTQNGFNKICKAYGIKIETPKLFIEEKKRPKTAGMINRIIKDLGIESYKLDKQVNDALGDAGNSITGQSIMTINHKTGRKKMYADDSANLYEKTEIVMKNIGVYLLGGFRKSIDSYPIHKNDIDEEARIFATVFMALRLFADYGGFDSK